MEGDRKNFSIAEDLLFEYEQQLSQLVYDSMLKNYNFTDEDYQVFVKLQDRLEQFLENNLEDKERSKIHLNNVKNRVYGINMPPAESKTEKIPPGRKIKRELASAIGITVCSEMK